MNVKDKFAWLDTCKQLHKVSGWEDTEYSWWVMQWGETEKHPTDTSIAHAFIEVPHYDLGYLLRKLPDTVEIGGRPTTLFTQKRHNGYYMAYMTRTGEHWPFDFLAIVKDTADTPENAACKLAIELFKQGILK